MSKSLLKLIIMLSSFAGVVTALLTLIPVVGGIFFWITFCLSAGIILGLIIKSGLLELQTVKDGIILGAISGFVTICAFSIVYIPITIVLFKLFKYYTNYGLAVALQSSSFGLDILLVIFIGILSATINAFTGFLTYYANDFMKSSNKTDNKENFSDYYNK